MKRFLLYLVLGIWLIVSSKYTYEVNQGDPALVISWNFAIFTSVLCFNLPIWAIIWIRGRRDRKSKHLGEGETTSSKYRVISSGIRKIVIISGTLWMITVAYQEGDSQVAIAGSDPVFAESSINLHTEKSQEKYIPGKEDENLTWLTIGQKSKNPVTWKTCKEIPVYLNSGENPTAEADVNYVLSYVNDVTGLNFSYAGKNDKKLVNSNNLKHGLIQITYGERESFIKEYRNITAIGIGGGIYSEGKIFSGQIALYEPAMSESSETLRRNVILHEFGHVLGLGHVTTAGDIMYPEVSNDNIVNYNEKVINYFLDNPGCK